MLQERSLKSGELKADKGVDDKEYFSEVLLKHEVLCMSLVLSKGLFPTMMVQRIEPCILLERQ